MGHITYQKTRLWRGDIPLESRYIYHLSQYSALYRQGLQKFRGAVVPDDVYFDSPYQVVNAYLPVDLPIAQSHKVGWSAKRLTDAPPLSPESLDAYLVLTFFGRIPENHPIERDGKGVTGECELCHVLFPGTWAILVWQKWLCLWHRTTQVLRRNPLYPNGVIRVTHPNLTDVFSGLSAFH